MPSSSHYTTRFEENDGGWWHVSCLCGWTGGAGFPDAEDAADAFGDHCFTVGLAFGVKE